MKKYMVVSPSFGDFRAGEPAAFKKATDVVNDQEYNVFEYEDNEGLVVATGERVYVTLREFKHEKPFSFIMIEVE